MAAVLRSLIASFLVLPLSTPAVPQTAGEVIRLFGDVLQQVERQSEQPEPRRQQPAPYAQPQGQAVPMTMPAGAGPAEVREAQQRLRALGYDAGPADGVMGRRTRSALTAFQERHGLVPDGQLGPRTMATLRSAEVAGTAVAAPAPAVGGGSIAGIYCAGSSSLAVTDTRPGEMEFGLSHFSGPFSCGHGGVARLEGGVWRHRSSEYGSACAIDFVPTAGGLTLRTRPGAGCIASCGAGAQIDGIRFPAGSRVASSGAGITVQQIFEGTRDPCG